MTKSKTTDGQVSDEQLIAQLRQAHTIAIVGLSPKPDRPSYRVAAYLQQVGFRIIPVRPAMETILGEPCFASLEAISAEIIIDVVDVFRKSEETPAIATAATRIMTRGGQGRGMFWLQSGIINNNTIKIAQNGGLLAVQDLCLMIEHRRLAKFLK